MGCRKWALLLCGALVISGALALEFSCWVPPPHVGPVCYGGGGADTSVAPYPDV